MIIILNTIGGLLVTAACWILYSRVKSSLVLTMSIASTLLAIFGLLFLGPVTIGIPSLYTELIYKVLPLGSIFYLLFAGSFLAYALSLDRTRVQINTPGK